MWNKFLEMLGFVWVRQRDKDGKYIPDNKKTKHKDTKPTETIERKQTIQNRDNTKFAGPAAQGRVRSCFCLFLLGFL